jgi:hypothetical protein
MLAGVETATGAELDLGEIDWPDRAQTYSRPLARIT